MTWHVRLTDWKAEMLDKGHFQAAIDLFNERVYAPAGHNGLREFARERCSDGHSYFAKFDGVEAQLFRMGESTTVTLKQGLAKLTMTGDGDGVLEYEESSPSPVTIALMVETFILHWDISLSQEQLFLP